MPTSFNIDIKTIISVIIAIITSIASSYGFVSTYLDNKYAKKVEFETAKAFSAIEILSNRKAILESRIYMFKMCKIDPLCPNKEFVDITIEQDLRDLQLVRDEIGILRQKNFER